MLLGILNLELLQHLDLQHIAVDIGNSPARALSPTVPKDEVSKVRD